MENSKEKLHSIVYSDFFLIFLDNLKSLADSSYYVCRVTLQQLVG